MLRLNDKHRQTVVTEALSWLNTPWKHQQRVKGTGVDCINLLCACAEEAQLKISVPPGYARIPKMSGIKTNIERNFSAIPIEELQLGDIILFSVNGDNNHVGIYLEHDNFIHALCRKNDKGKVQINQLDRAWKNKISKTYSLLSYTHDQL